jgi:starch phosphorylase
LIQREVAERAVARDGDAPHRVACSIHDIVYRYKKTHPDFSKFAEKVAIQLNDTHPAVAVPELMRLLMDVHGYGWDDAWDMTRRTFSYTNHTLLPEALERWPLALFGALLPRHLEIIYEINRRFLAEVRLARPGDEDLLRRVSLIDESGERYVRMAHVAVVGGHAVNGVAALHTRLLREDLLKDFDALAPGKIQNVTNGVTPRRWVVSSNPGLTKIISDAIGEKWIFRAEDELVQLEPFAADAAFRAAWNRVKAENKNRLAARLKSATGLVMDPAALLDVQVKRIHEYKRQHLSVLHIVRRFLDLKARPQSAPVPRTFLFGGKAAPGYFMAKLIIRFINAVGEAVNRDPAVSRVYRVAFFPDFNVKNGEFIYPAAELSEQISTAGKEASGTGNMKFTLNGALTVGTLDGANVEIREAVGEENFFLFGHTVGEVGAALRNGYRGRDVYDRDPRVKEVIDSISSGFFSRGDPGVFRPLVDSLMGADPYLTLADFSSYLAAQDRIDQTRRDPDAWSRRSILNVARAGLFSSDRSIREYAQNIWHVPLGEPDA